MNRLAWMMMGLVLLTACSQSENTNTLFQELSSRTTDVDFENTLSYDENFNIYTYRNFYNGGGVALGDVNQDGLTDIYFTGNMEQNRLYLNRGDFQFEDVTEMAGVAGEKAWSTGVAMADVNADGWLDIYVCNSGGVEGDNKQNELFINNQDGTFSEQAEQFGIADQGLSTHGVFFDYDRDGDLDLYLLNNSFRAIGSFNLKRNERYERDAIGGDKLYKNVGGRFEDVSETAGVYGSIIGFGLGVTVGDVNLDGWQDIYVSNDFFERDYLYINNQDGTFKEVLTEQMNSISAASMGADMADMNNDGYPEIFVTEMLPEKDDDIKQKTTFEGWNEYQNNLVNDYYHQFTRNMLQLNNGDGTFSEIGRLAGVEATDWSWGALMCDLDNDGLRDIYVANGIYQSLTDQDYIDFIANAETQRMIITREGVDFKKLIDSIPSYPVPNYAFQNQGDLQFENKAPEWGLATEGHSNGAAYGDLDNDGDLDLVVNNVNMPASIYRNQSSSNYLQFQLSGEGTNTQAVGSRVTIFYGDTLQTLEHMPMRGFQSSMDYVVHFGLGETHMVERVLIDWADGKQTTLDNIAANQRLELHQNEGTAVAAATFRDFQATPLFTDVSNDINIDFEHQENRFSDFDRERLIYHMMSTLGPKIDVADVNGDGRDDFYICGAKDSAGKLFIQQASGDFRATNEVLFEQGKLAEEVDCLFFDADGDGDQDLYIAAGGNELPNSSSGLIDRLYFNDGKGNFYQSKQTLPTFNFESTSCVRATDFDGDGDQDLFVGLRLRPFLYGVPVNGYLLENDGSGQFKNVSQQVAPDLKSLGMITDAQWADTDGDGDEDLVVVGEWMPITIFENENGQFTPSEIANSSGWWNCLQSGDFNSDGRPDFIIGNHGLNSRFRASETEPIKMFVNDFDQNGSAEQIIARYEDGKLLPFTRRHDLVMQMPPMKKKYLRYRNYVGQTVDQVFTPEQLENALELEVQTLKSVALMSSENGYALQALPRAAQTSPIYGIQVDDFDADGQLDVLIGGNFYNAKPEVGRYDAGYGLLLKGNEDGAFDAIAPKVSGFQVNGEVRDMEGIEIDGKSSVLVARNSERIAIFGLNKTVQ
ncbi:MAG: VCBS repeat-containing protein [Bacteroidota bacterium]